MAIVDRKDDAWLVGEIIKLWRKGNRSPKRIHKLLNRRKNSLRPTLDNVASRVARLRQAGVIINYGSFLR